LRIPLGWHVTTVFWTLLRDHTHWRLARGRTERDFIRPLEWISDRSLFRSLCKLHFYHLQGSYNQQATINAIYSSKLDMNTPNTYPHSLIAILINIRIFLLLWYDVTERVLERTVAVLILFNAPKKIFISPTNRMNPQHHSVAQNNSKPVSKFR
jgi:hypothetical protein